MKTLLARLKTCPDYLWVGMNMLSLANVVGPSAEGREELEKCLARCWVDKSSRGPTPLLDPELFFDPSVPV